MVRIVLLAMVLPRSLSACILAWLPIRLSGLTFLIGQRTTSSFHGRRLPTHSPLPKPIHSKIHAVDKGRWLAQWSQEEPRAHLEP